MKGRIYVISFLLIVSTTAFAQSSAITATTDKQKILIGEPLHLSLKVTVPRAQPVQWFTFDTLPHFEVLSKSKVDSQLNSNSIQLQQTYTLTSWDSGRFQLPSFHLPAVQNKTKPIAIDVTYTPFDTTQDYHDVKDIINVAQPARTTWYWYVIGAVLLILLFVLLFPWKKKQPVAEKPVSNESAYKEAMQQLEKLKKQSIAEKDSKSFYTGLIDIFRTYLHRRKGIQSFSKTTDDLAVQIKTLNLPSDKYNNLVETLQLSDWVKFAKYQPQGSENENALEKIKSSIAAIENIK